LTRARREQRIANLYAAAHQAVESEAWAEAIDHAHKLLSLDPGHHSAVELLQHAEQQQTAAEQIATLTAQFLQAELRSNTGEMVRIGEQILGIKPDHQPTRSNLATLHGARARLASLRGEYKEAINSYSRAVELDPDNAVYYGHRGLQHLLQEEYDRATADLQRALEVEPTNQDYYVWLSAGYFNQGDYAQAIAVLNTAPEPHEADYYAWRGLSYAAIGNASALDDYNRAIDLNSTHPAYLYARGLWHIGQGDNARSQADLRRATELDPGNARYFEWRSGRAFKIEEAGHQTPAVSTQSTPPTTATAYYARGMQLVAENKYEQAVEDFSQAVSLDPQHVAAYLSRGEAYYVQGKYSLAITDFDRAIALDQHNAAAYFWRGRSNIDKGTQAIFFAKGFYNRALADLLRATELAPANGEYYYWRGKVQALKGNQSAAAADLKQAAQLGSLAAKQELV
jgi:tetratricopeptide (TPR) repeat protein